MSAKTSPLLVKIENEVETADIQKYSESAMKELLGWYGYGGTHESTDIVASNSSKLSSMALPHDLTSTISNDISTTVTMLVNKRHRNTLLTDKMHNSNIIMENVDLINSVQNKNANIIDKQDECGWCKRPVSLGSTEFLASPEGLIYCTESCFTQSRRASFKRAKTCDWCKHIRHAISYVDFQDGATQLQFCSDKCLNQYKMQIFCKETQAHLDMNPHLKEKGSSSTNALITPDLWLKDCRSRSISPSNSEHSISPTPLSDPIEMFSSASDNATNNQSQKRPLITVTPASKLISGTERMPIRMPLHDGSTAYLTRLMRKRRSQRLQLNARHSGYQNVIKNQNITSNSTNKNDTRIISSPDKCANATISNNEPKSAAQCSSDIEIARQSAAKKLLLSLHSATAKVNSSQRRQLLPPPPDLYPLNTYHGSHRQPLRLPHFCATNHQHPASTASVENRSPTIDTAASPFQMSSIFSACQTASTPMTLLVPYPIVIPIPIPVPLPLESFLKAAKIKLDAEKAKDYFLHSHRGHETPDSILSDTNDISSLDLSNGIGDLRAESFAEQPLDFTKDASKKVICDSIDSMISAQQEFDNNHLHRDNDSIGNKLLFPTKLNSRFHTKRSFSKESESSRPLRKRKRTIDSDYLLKSNI